MGTDIHLYTERRVDGRWVTCDNWKIDPKYPEEGRQVDWEERFTDRNYDLFAMLADVRNGSGFAGVKTGSGFVPIHPPRGVPEDACPEYREHYEKCGEHTPSWATLAELLAYDWTRESIKTGIVDLRGLGRWKENGSPDSWSGGIGGMGIQIFSQEQGVRAVDTALQEAVKRGEKLSWWSIYHLPGGPFGMDSLEGLKPGEKALVARIHELLECARPHFQVSWGVTYARAAGSFWTSEIPRLLRLGRPEDVRICYYFDN